MAGLVAVTLTPGKTAPELSVTVPLMLPVVWPNAGDESSTARTRADRDLLIHPPLASSGGAKKSPTILVVSEATLRLPPVRCKWRPVPPTRRFPPLNGSPKAPPLRVSAGMPPPGRVSLGDGLRLSESGTRRTGRRRTVRQLP